MILIDAAKNKLAVREMTEVLTSGSVRVYPVRFRFNSDWKGLVKNATFRAGSTSVSVVLDETGECTIPWEVLVRSGYILEVGVCGTQGTAVVLPTIWANLGTIQEGAQPGANAQEPTPSVYQKLIAQLDEGRSAALAAANRAKIDADRAAQINQTVAETRRAMTEKAAEATTNAGAAAQAAKAAAAARTAIENMVVEAITLATGRPATVSKELTDGVVKLVLGLPAGKQGDKGDPGSSIKSIARTAGTGAPGATDTYTVTLTDGSTTEFYVYNGADGADASDAQVQAAAEAWLAAHPEATTTVQDKSISEAKLSQQLWAQINNAEILQLTGSVLDLQNCLQSPPLSFTVQGETVRGGSLGDITSYDAISVVVNDTQYSVQIALNSLTKKDGSVVFDELDVVGKVVQRRIKKLVFTGDESFESSIYYANIYTIPNQADYTNAESNYDTTCGAICSHFGRIGFASITPAGTYKNGYFGLKGDGSAINFGYCPDGETQATPEQLQAYFAEQYAAGTPVTVYYILRTEREESIDLPDIALAEGSNAISNTASFEMDISYYAKKQASADVENLVVQSIKQNAQALDGDVSEEDAWWGDFRNKMGFDPAEQPVPQEVKKPLVTDSMVIVKGGKGRWGTDNSGGYTVKGEYYEGSPFADGGHVFEGWNASETYRLTMLMGKFIAGNAHIFTFKPQESGVEVYGVVTIGSDHQYEGLDVAPKYAHMYGTMIAGAGFTGVNNYGSQKYYGGISGADRATPAGANMEITAGANAIPSRVQFNDCKNGMKIPVLESDPTVLEDGVFWFNSAEGAFKGIVGGEVKTFGVS